MTSTLAMFMTRARWGFLVSTLALSLVMAVWSDMFLWAKVGNLPTWVEALPSPILAPAYLAFVCLVPATFVPETLSRARSAIMKSVLLAPLSAVAVFALNPLHQNAAIPFNVLFHYVWIVLFHCLVPALLLVAIRTAAHVVLRQKHG